MECGLEAPQVDLDAVELDKAEQDECGADHQAKHSPCRTGEGHVLDQCPRSEGERAAREGQEPGSTDGQGARIPESST